jgi:WD40 repeat protein
VIAGCGGHTIHGWNIETDDSVFTFKAEMPVTNRFALSPDNQHVLSGGGDRDWRPVGDYDLRLWNLPSPPAPLSQEN